MTRIICTQNKADRAVQASPSAKARTLVFSNLFGLSMQCKEMKQVKLIKCILLLAMGIAVLGCSNSEFEKHRVVDLTELVPHEGRIEIPLSIVEETQRGGYHVFVAKGIYRGDMLGMMVKLKGDYSPSFDIDGIYNEDLFIKNGTELISIGVESDRLLQFMARKYGLSDSGLKMRKRQALACINLSRKKPDYKSGEIRFKMLLEREYKFAELLMNFDFSKRIISINEKDTIYRQPLIDILRE